MPKHPLISDAAKGGAVNQLPSATFKEGLAEPAREELIAALRVSSCHTLFSPVST